MLREYDFDKKTETKDFKFELDKLIGKLDTKGDRVSNQTNVARVFSEVVGSSVASNIEKIFLNKEELVVIVSNHIWAQELSYFKTEYITRTNTLLGRDLIKTMRIVGAKRSNV